MVSIWFFIALSVALAAVFLLGHRYTSQSTSAAKNEDLTNSQNVEVGGGNSHP